MKKYLWIGLTLLVALTTLGCEKMFVVNINSYLVDVQVLRKNWAPFENVEVYLMNGSEAVSSTSTNADGHLKTRFSVPGDWTSVTFKFVYWQITRNGRVQQVAYATFGTQNRASEYWFTAMLDDITG